MITTSSSLQILTIIISKKKKLASGNAELN